LKKAGFLPKYTLGEELLSSISHGVGTALSVAGCVVAIVYAAKYGTAWSVVSAAIFGASLIILYCMSTLYHAITAARAKTVLRVLDHTTIFLLIAGTYTPITLVTLRGPLGWTMFGLVWASAILGIVLNAVSIEKFKVFSMISYVASGWAVIIGIKPLIENLEKNGLILLVAGGIMYTAGLVFYALKNIKYMHGIWHFFVMAGSILHYFCILFYVLPDKI